MNSEKFGGIASTDFNDLGLVQDQSVEQRGGDEWMIEDLMNQLKTESIKTDAPDALDETKLEGVDRAKLEDRGEETLSAYEVAKTNFEKVEEEYKQKREILDRYREELENADDNWHKYLSEEAIKVAEQSVAEIGEAYQKAYQELVAAKGDVKEMNEADKPSEEEINGLIELAKSNKGSAQAIQLAITFAAMAVVTTLTAAFGAGLFGGGKDKAPAESSEPAIEDEFRDTGAAEEVKLPDGVEIEETYEGIRDGYDQPGMYIDANSEKGTHKFANASMMQESMPEGADAREYIKAVGGAEVEAMASYIFAMSEKFPEEYQGLTDTEIEQKLESLSDKEFEGIRDYFNEVIDRANAEGTVLNGEYENFWIAQKEKGGDYSHENMELRHCVTKEKDTLATKLSWDDGGTMVVKLGQDENGNWNGCVQVVFEKDDPKTTSITSKEIEPDKPNPEPAPTPEEEKVKPKSAENEKRIVEQAPLAGNVTQTPTSVTESQKPTTQPNVESSKVTEVSEDKEGTTYVDANNGAIMNVTKEGEASTSYDGGKTVENYEEEAAVDDNSGVLEVADIASQEAANAAAEALQTQIDSMTEQQKTEAENNEVDSLLSQVNQNNGGQNE